MTTETVALVQTEDGLVHDTRWTETYRARTIIKAWTHGGRVFLGVGTPAFDRGSGFDLSFDGRTDSFGPEDAEHLAGILVKLAAEARQA